MVEGRSSEVGVEVEGCLKREGRRNGVDHRRRCKDKG